VTSKNYDQRYEASRKTLGELLYSASKPIKVPDWQRSYSWTNAQTTQFWADVMAFSDRYRGEHIKGREYFLGSVVLVTEPDQLILLDGQQRIATATILLSALRDARQSYNADAAGRLQQKFISDFNDTKKSEQPKLTLNDYDRSFFADEIQSRNPSGDKPKLKSHKLIRKAKQYFTDKINEEYTKYKDPGEAYDKVNLRLELVLVDHISVVAVTSSDEDNAAAVFETLNDRGIGLSTTDLLRSLLIRRAKPEDRTEIGNHWLKILSINDQAPVDQFLRHFWISKRGDEKSRSLYRVLKEHIEDDEVDSLEFTEELSRAADIYRDICTFNADTQELRETLREISNLGAKVLYPALLSAFSACANDKRSSDNLRDFAKSLLILFVRYNVIAQKESTLLEATVFEVAKEIRKECDFAGMTIKLRQRAPDLTEFAKQFSLCSITRGQTATYLLRELDHYHRPTGELLLAGTNKVHLEHIYPQVPGAKWATFDNPSAWINRLGNLTLLDKGKNASIGNSVFSEKKAEYAESAIFLTQHLTAFEVWGREQIVERQISLALAAAHIWKFPGETVPDNLEKTLLSTDIDLEEVEDLPDYPEAP
jgi:uncharacterized protein with ParB-like and HNH nuclease domain